jgi:hypothetical protein
MERENHRKQVPHVIETCEGKWKRDLVFSIERDRLVKKKNVLYIVSVYELNGAQ